MKQIRVGDLMSTSVSWIEQSLARHYVDDRPLWGEPRPLSKGWTPSGLGEPNDRLLVASQLGYRGDLVTEKMRRVFDAGNDIEDRWVKRFKAMGLLRSHGEWLPAGPSDGLVIRGKLDLVVVNPSSRELEIIEVKSISPTGFNSLPAAQVSGARNSELLWNVSGGLRGRLRKYLLQLWVYMDRMGLSKGHLLFDNKGTQEFRDFNVEVDSVQLSRVYSRLRDLQDEYWAKELLPPWNGGRGKSLMATYRPNEAVPLSEIKGLYVQEEEW